MTHFSVDLNKLLEAAAAWRDASADGDRASGLAQKISTSHQDVTWSIFQEAWQAQVDAAKYMKDRLAEASSEAISISNVLTHVATVYREQDANFANTLTKLQSGL